MPANGRLSKISGARGGQSLGGRRGPLIIAAISAILAVVLIYVFVSNHDSSSTTPVALAPQQATVFVATQYIPAGTPAAVIASEGLLKRKSIMSSETIPGAIYDPSQISSQTTTESIEAGQQVTTVEFSPAAKISIPSYLQGTYRGVSFSLNPYQGLTSGISAGEDVDVMLLKSGSHASELIASNIEVLGNSGGNVTLRLTDKQALLLTAATTAGSLWLDYRPAHGAKQTIKVGDQEAL